MGLFFWGLLIGLLRGHRAFDDVQKCWTVLVTESLR